MSYTGYNVEDAILINQGAVDRGLFRTTYFSMYESREENEKTSNDSVDTRFADVLKVPDMERIKPKYDYNNLNEYGIIREGTEMNDKTVVIGKVVAVHRRIPEIRYFQEPCACQSTTRNIISADVPIYY